MVVEWWSNGGRMVVEWWSHPAGHTRLLKEWFLRGQSENAPKFAEKPIIHTENNSLRTENPDLSGNSS